jgi:hypothetical protein
MSGDLCRMVSIVEEEEAEGEHPPTFVSYLSHTLTTAPSAPLLDHHVQVVSSSSVCTAAASFEHQTCYFNAAPGGQPLIPVNNALAVHHYQQRCINYYTR